MDTASLVPAWSVSPGLLKEDCSAAQGVCPRHEEVTLQMRANFPKCGEETRVNLLLSLMAFWIYRPSWRLHEREAEKHFSSGTGNMAGSQEDLVLTAVSQAVGFPLSHVETLVSHKTRSKLQSPEENPKIDLA